MLGRRLGDVVWWRARSQPLTEFPERTKGPALGGTGSRISPLSGLDAENVRYADRGGSMNRRGARGHADPDREEDANLRSVSFALALWTDRTRVAIPD